MKALIPLLICLVFSQIINTQSIINFADDSQGYTLPNGDKAVAFDVLETQHKKTNQYQKLIHVILPTPEGDVELSLQKQKILSNGFSVKAKKADGTSYIIPFNEGAFYKGVVDEKNNINATIYIYENKISGVLQWQSKTYNIGFNPQIKRHVIFEHFNSDAMPHFTCNQLGEVTSKNNNSIIQKSTINCGNAVSIYYECDFDMYNYFNDVNVLTNYVLSTFNEVHTLYSNENIPLEISEIAIWIEDDPYVDNASGIYDFADALLTNSFQGDVAQLLTNDPGQNGGTAYVDQLCGALPFGYCDLINTSEYYPTYSWDVQVMSHELGHTFGSHHTHDCVWGPNGDTQIDDCGNLINGGDTCYDYTNPIIPENGGTIMSYCHLNPIGINFSNGFGLEPGSLMRTNHQSCFCDNAHCEAATEIFSSGMYNAHPSDGNGASTSNASHADWFVITPNTSMTLSVNSCDEGVDTRVWIWEGSCDNLIFKALSDDDCHSSNGNQYASSIQNLQLQADVTYFIEWDNRWSGNAFSWEVLLDYNQLCDDSYIFLDGIVSDTTLHAEMTINASNKFHSNSNVIFGAGESIELMPGFEMELGSTLNLLIEGCVN